MYRILLALAMAGASGRMAAQTLMDTETPAGKKAAEIFAKEWVAKDSSPLQCEVTQIKPQLNFTFRYQAGYRLQLPFRQFSEAPHAVVAALRIQPRDSDAQSSYFLQSFRWGKLPPHVTAHRSKFEASFQGGFFLGEGQYQADLVLQDENGRQCRRSWKIGHVPKAAEGMKEFLAPGKASDLRLSRLARFEARQPRPYRIAILLHAAPQWPRASMMSSFDVFTLMSSLTALLEGTLFAETAVTVFSLQKQKELYRTAHLDRMSFSGLGRTLRQLENATVDWTTLQNPGGQADLLARLINREAAAADPPDAVILMGPKTWHSVKVPEGMLERSSLSPPVFYLRHEFIPHATPFRDTVEDITHRAGGRLFTVRGPKDLAAAIQKIEAQLAARGSRRVTSQIPSERSVPVE